MLDFIYNIEFIFWLGSKVPTSVTANHCKEYPPPLDKERDFVRKDWVWYTIVLRTVSVSDQRITIYRHRHVIEKNADQNRESNIRSNTRKHIRSNTRVESSAIIEKSTITATSSTTDKVSNKSNTTTLQKIFYI